MWETDGARVALFSKTIKSAKVGGVWEDLVRYAVPEWIEANLEGARSDITFKYTVEPKVDGSTRTSLFKIQNYWGSESEIYLFSLDFDGEVAEKVKGTRFSMMWFSELTNFDDRAVYTISKQQLRMPHLRPEQHMWIADTNPSEDGEENWIYQLWYIERLLKEPPEHLQGEGERAAFKLMQSQMDLIEIMLEDNPYITREQKQQVMADHIYDRDLYERAVNGKWVSGTSKDRLFSDCYKPALHRVGDVESVREEEWEVALPSENCFELITGWDLGETSHSAHILEKIGSGDQIHWVVLDELVIINERMGIKEFVDIFMGMMAWMEKAVAASGNKRQIAWRHYSDDSVNKYRSAIDDYERNVVWKASKEKIELEGVPKPDGSIMARIYLLRRLLHDRRIHISAQCTRTHDMLRRARKGRARTEPFLRDQHKHPFDSLTYPIIMESSYDAAITKPVHRGQIGAIVSVPLA